jgi:hypothetical protein
MAKNSVAEAMLKLAEEISQQCIYTKIFNSKNIV